MCSSTRLTGASSPRTTRLDFMMFFGSSTMSSSYFDQTISPWTTRWSFFLILSRMDLSSSERRKRDTRTEFVRSVRSKQSTAPPPLGIVRLVTATTSPSTVTLPDSRVSVCIGTGRCLMALPMSTLPWGLPPGAGACVISAACEARFGRG